MGGSKQTEEFKQFKHLNSGGTTFTQVPFYVTSFIPQYVNIVLFTSIHAVITLKIKMWLRNKLMHC